MTLKAVNSNKMVLSSVFHQYFVLLQVFLRVTQSASYQQSRSGSGPKLKPLSQGMTNYDKTQNNIFLLSRILYKS